MDRIVGIDLGTSTSCLAAVIDGEPVVVPDSRGNRVTPSYIHVMDDGRILVGPQAKMEVISDPYSTIWATKRLIGRRYDDPEVQEAKKYFGYEILRAADGGVRVRGREKELSPTEVSAIILKYLTRIGKKVMGQEVRRVVITVPAYFTDPQRKATMESGAMIGLDVVKLINEPTAAALAYGYNHDVEERVAIYDLGGGTFDLSILNIGQGVFEVIATDGDSYLGGEDFDNRLVDFIVRDFKNKHGISIFNDKMAHQRVKDAAERTKIALSGKEDVEINLPAMCPDLNRWAGVEMVITRDQYESMVSDLVTRTVDVFQRLLKELGMSVADIDNVIMVGGMTRMPLVRRVLTDFYGRELDTSMNPDEAVAVGAAIHAASLSGERLKRKTKRPEAKAPPPDVTLPGFPPEPELTTLGLAAPGDATRPGTPMRETVPHLPPPPEPSRARTADYSDTSLPAEKTEFDASLPVEREARKKTAPEPPAQEEAPPPSPEPPEEPAAPGSSLYPDQEMSGLDEFFHPPATAAPEPEPAPTEPSPTEPPAEMEAAPEYPPPETESAPEQPPEEMAAAEEEEEPIAMGDADVPEPEAPPVPAEDEQTMPPFQTAPSEPEEPMPPEAAQTEADEEPAAPEQDLLPADRDEVSAPAEPETPAPAEAAPEPFPEAAPPEVLSASEPEPMPETAPPPDEHPVSAGPIIRDFGEQQPAPKPARAEDEQSEYMQAPVLLDVLSQSVGVAHFGGLFVPLIKRFSKLPARATQVFTTCTDNQTRIRITVLQGEGEHIRENTPLGEFVLEGIEKIRRGMPEIEVTFDIDQSGIFTVSARDKHSGSEKTITLDDWAGGRAPEEGQDFGRTRQ